MVAYRFTKAFRQDSTQEGLHKLLNATVRLSVHEVDSGAQLASAALDMLPLAFGNQRFSCSNVQLVPAEDIKNSSVKVVAGFFPLVDVSLTLRQPAEGTSPEEAAAHVQAPPADLPEPVPWQYVSTEEVEAGCNVIELNISDLSPVPPGLLVASNAAREGKTPGQLTVSVAVALPGGPPVVVSGISVQQDGALQLGLPLRQCITGDQAQALLEHLEDGLPLQIEVARYLQHEQLQDTLWEQYHAAGNVLGAGCLAAMGSSRHEEELQLSGFTADLASVLPPYVPTNLKGKPLEDAAKTSRAATPDSAQPGLPLTAWEQAGTRLSLSLSLMQPLVPHWNPPPKPEAPLPSLVQPRPALARYVAPVDAMDKFKQLVSEMGSSVKEMALQRAKCTDGSVPSVRALTAELQGNGQYITMRQAVADAAVHVALERYSKAHDAAIGGAPAGPDAEAVSALHEELHAVLTEQLTCALVAADGEQAMGADAQMQKLLLLAAECEEAGLLRRAEALHQRRVLLTSSGDPAAWHSYGALCMRAGRQGRGEECFRQGMGLAGAGSGACRLALAAALLHQARVTDVLFLKEAELMTRELLDGEVDQVLLGHGTVLRVLVSEAAGDDSKAVAEEAMQQLVAHEARALEEGCAPAAANLCLEAAACLLHLGLPMLALSALGHARELPLTAAALHDQIALCEADALGQLSDADSEHKALGVLQVLSAQEGSTGAAAAELQGHIAFKAGRHTDCVHAYQAALSKLPPGQPASSKLYLQLAQSYAALRHPDYALNVYNQACASAPSASAWLGVSACRTALEEYEAAGQALTEAALLDPENPSVWGRIALVALKAGRPEEAATALKCAVRLGLEDGALLTELGREYAGKEGRGRAAENLLRVAVGKRPDDDEVQQLLEGLVAQRSAA